MINPEFQGNINDWIEVIPREFDQPWKKITDFPKLKEYLLKDQWLNKGGNPEWEEISQKLRKEIQENPEKVMYNINIPKHQVKLQMPLEAKKRVVIILQIPKMVKFICSAEQPKVRLAPTEYDVERLSNCSGSMKNYCSSDDILTEFEIEETTKMVRKWIKKRWYVPSNPNAVIILNSSSDSDEPSKTTNMVIQRLKAQQISRKPRHKSSQTLPSTPSLSPPSPQRFRRPAIKVDKYDLFCDDSSSKEDSEDSILP